MIDANGRMSVDVLLTGANGRLGEAVAREFAHTAPTLRVAALGRSLLDAAEQEAVHEAFSRLAPRVVVNAAAFTDVAAAQAAARNSAALDVVMRANARAPEVLAQACAAHGASLIHFSTDYVFSGGGSRMRTEVEKPQPFGVYGRSKRAGEAALEHVGRQNPTFRYLIFRLSWLHGAPGDFVAKVLDAALAGRLSRMRNDQWGRPTSYESAAKLAVQTTQRELMNEGAQNSLHVPIPRGIYHFAEPGPVVNRLRLAKLILGMGAVKLAERGCLFESEMLRRAGESLQGCRMHDRARPANCRLNCGKLSGLVAIDCFSWNYYVDKSVENFLQSRLLGMEEAPDTCLDKEN